MLFTIPGKYNINKNYLIAKILKLAKTRILFYRMGATETKLNEYLLANCKKSLKETCLLIINNTNIQITTDKIIITFKNNIIDSLATLITYGDSAMQGSRILRSAFNLK